jgi:hypothetical protein
MILYFILLFFSFKNYYYKSIDSQNINFLQKNISYTNPFDSGRWTTKNGKNCDLLKKRREMLLNQPIGCAGVL